MTTLFPALERRLKAGQAGEVRFDAFTRGRYSTDASHYQIMPLGVVAPRTIEEAVRAIGICRAEGVPVTPRGGGTSQAGQTVNTSVDHRLRAPPQQCDRGRHRQSPLRGRAGHRARRAQSQTESHGALVSGRYLYRIARNDRRHGRQQFLRRALAALRQHARERAVDRRRVAGRHACTFRPHRRCRRQRAASFGERSARACRARGRRDRAALSESAAPRRRL